MSFGDSRNSGYFQSWTAWHDPKMAHQLIEIIKQFPILGNSELRFGPSDARTFKMDELDADQIEEWWRKVRGGHFKITKPWKFQIAIMYFNVPGKRISNTLWFYLNQEYFSDADRVAAFFSFCKGIYHWGNIDNGYISTRQEIDHKREMGLFGRPRAANLNIGLPGVYLANFIGPRYVNWIGEGKFKSLKTYSKEKLEDGGWFFTTREDVNKCKLSDLMRDERRIVKHLGKKPFFVEIKFDQ